VSAWRAERWRPSTARQGPRRKVHRRVSGLRSPVRQEGASGCAGQAFSVARREHVFHDAFPVPRGLLPKTLFAPHQRGYSPKRPSSPLRKGGLRQKGRAPRLAAFPVRLSLGVTALGQQAGPQAFSRGTVSRRQVDRGSQHVLRLSKAVRAHQRPTQRRTRTWMPWPQPLRQLQQPHGVGAIHTQAQDGAKIIGGRR